MFQGFSHFENSLYFRSPRAIYRIQNHDAIREFGLIDKNRQVPLLLLSLISPVEAIGISAGERRSQIGSSSPAPADRAS